MKSRPAAEFLLLLLLSILAGWTTLAATFTLAWASDEYTHILLIIPVSAALIWMDRSAFASNRERDLKSGSILLIAAVCLMFMARLSPALAPDEKLTAGMLALVTWWIGAFILCFGIVVARVLLFPLVFLYWLTPFPNFLLHDVIAWLQQGSAVAANLLFELAGVPVVQDGVRLSIPGLTVEVATECSSIRSSIMLLVTTMVLAQLILRSPWRKLVAITIAVPLSVAKNGLRIFTIAMLGTRVDRGYLTGKLHHEGGGVFFGIALLLMFLVLWILQRGDNASLSKRQTIAPAHSGATPN